MASWPLDPWDEDEWKAIIASWPKPIRKYMGPRLRTVQNGQQPATGAKPLRNFKISLWELKHRDGQRVIYTTAYTGVSGCIHIVDAFMKDSSEGEKMRKADKVRITKRVTALKKMMDQLEAEIKARRRGLH